MDRINPHPPLNPITTSFSQQPENKTPPSSKTAKPTPCPELGLGAIHGLYSKMFDDEALQRLQSTLESIAELSSVALEQIRKRN